MARRSKIQNRKAISTLLVLAAACLVAVGVTKIDHHYLLAGAQLIGWAFVPLAIVLGFTWPVICKVKTTGRKACGNWAYGLLFGCDKVAGHRTGKFLVRLGLKNDETKPVERRQPSVNTAILNQPVPQSKPVKVTVEESALAKCGFWVGFISGIVGIVQAIVTAVH